MPIQKHKKKHTKTIAIMLFVLAFAIAVALFFMLRKPADPIKNGINYGSPSAAEKKDAESQKLAQNEPKPDQQPAVKTTEITNVYQDQNGAVVVQTKLQGTGWQKCTITFSKQGLESVVRTADVLYQPSFSTCAGFSIPQNDFAQKGDWTVTLTVINPNQTIDTSNTKTITIQ